MKDLFAGLIVIFVLLLDILLVTSIVGMITCKGSGCGAVTSILPFFWVLSSIIILPLQIRALKYFKHAKKTKTNKIMYPLAIMGLWAWMSPLLALGVYLLFMIFFGFTTLLIGFIGNYF